VKNISISVCNKGVYSKEHLPLFLLEKCVGQLESIERTCQSLDLDVSVKPFLELKRVGVNCDKQHVETDFPYSFKTPCIEQKAAVTKKVQYRPDSGVQTYTNIFISFKLPAGSFG
jgi:hypothetical protein